MKAAVAGLCVVGCMIGAVATLSATGLMDRVHPAVAGLGLSILMLLLCAVALAVFNGGSWRDLALGPDLVRKWEVQGLLAATDYEATRAFQVDERDDEGPHYFVELKDGSVLFLSGPYLSEHEPIDDDAEENQPRRFPCSKFRVRRHVQLGHVVKVECEGTVLQPQTLAPAFTSEEHTSGDIPEDGQIIRDRTYDELLAQRCTHAHVSA